MANCPICGVELPEDAKVCAVCGKEFAPGELSALQGESPAQNVLDTVEEKTQEQPSEQPAKPEKRQKPRWSAFDPQTGRPQGSGVWACLVNSFFTTMPILGGMLQTGFLVFGTAALLDSRTAGMWWWIPLLVFFAISLVKLVVTVFWACGVTRSVTRRNHARAALILDAIAVALMIALYFAVRSNLNEYLAYAMAYGYEDIIAPFAPLLIP